MGTAVITTSEDLRPFLKDITIFMNSGVFDFKNGCVIIHRDENGIIKKIEQEVLRYIKININKK